MTEKENSEIRLHEPGAGVLRNSTFILAARALQIGSSLIVFVLVARYLSVEQYGDYAFIWALVSAVMAISYFGIQQALIRAVAKDRSKAPELIGTAIRLRLILSLVAAIILLVSIWYAALSRTAIIGAMVAILSELFLSFSMLAKAVFQSFERMVYEPILTFTTSLILLTGIVLVIVLDMGFVWLFVVMAIANGVQLFLAANIMSRKFVKPVTTIGGSMLKEMLTDSLIIGFGVICYLNLFKINTLMLKWLGNIQDVAYFQVPHSMIMQIQVIPLALITALFPVLSRLMADDHAEVVEMFEKAAKYLLICSSFIGVFLFTFAEDLLLPIFGAKYGPSIPALKIVAWAIVPLSIDMLLNSLLLAMNKQKYVLLYAATTLAFATVMAYLFIPDHGYIAAAYIAVFSYLLLLLLSFTLVWHSNIRIPIARPLLGTGLAVLCSGLVAVYCKEISLFLALLACIVFYFGVHFIFKTLTLDEIFSIKAARKKKRSLGSL